MKKNLFFVLASLLLFPTLNKAQPCKQVVGYYCDWLATTIDYSKYTVINYAFVKPQTTGTIDAPVVGTGQLTSLVSAAHQKGVKVLVSVGGWTWSDNFPTIAASDATRKKFASECQRYITTYNLDGIDIDWEYPGYSEHSGTSADKVNATLLMKEIRTAIGSKLLTGCYGVSATHMGNIEWSKVITYMDMINLMTYDFFGTWDAVTNHNSPLYAPAQGEPSFNLNAAFKALTNTYGVPSTKVNIGAAFYGHSFNGATKLFGTHSGAGFKEGSPTYAEIQAVKSGYTDYWDDNAKVPYMINTSEQVFISYDNPKSIKLKGQYAKANNALGVIVWEISGDYVGGANPLAVALNDGLCNATNVEEPTFQDAAFYPNPATESLNVSIANGYINNTVAVYNTLGQQVISKQFNAFSFAIDLNGLEKGVYLVNVVNAGGTISKTIVKE